MKGKDISKSIVIILVILVVMIFVSYYFVFRDIKNRNEHISNLQQDLSNQNKKNQYIFGLQQTFQNADSDITRIDNSIIASDSDVKFIESLEAMAREDGLSIDINSLSFEEIPSFSSSGLVIFKVRATARGFWSRIYNFLAQIESMPLKVKVNNFSLSNTVSLPDPSDSSSVSVSSWQSTFEISILKYK